eukprot:366157-Chlamydomonas_euryale.AAC.10
MHLTRPLLVPCAPFAHPPPGAAARSNPLPSPRPARDRWWKWLPHMPDRGEMRRPNPGEAFVGSNNRRGRCFRTRRPQQTTFFQQRSAPTPTSFSLRQDDSSDSACFPAHT